MEEGGGGGGGKGGGREGEGEGEGEREEEGWEEGWEYMEGWEYIEGRSSRGVSSGRDLTILLLWSPSFETACFAFAANPAAATDDAKDEAFTSASFLFTRAS